MNIQLSPGTYVAAVSGGVDSMVMLDMLRQTPEVRVTVAHFDHGIRLDSHKDRQLVQQIADRHGLPFIFSEGKLGAGASEAEARKARYEFLHQVKQATGANAILFAHHQDDAIETAVINLMRGTGRKGLSSLHDRPGITRPLLHMTKRQLRAYALANKLEWREDSTNKDTAYLRNYVRHVILPKLSVKQRQELREIIQSIHQTNQAIDIEIANYLHVQPARNELSRPMFMHLPHKAALEVMAGWLRAQGIRSFDTKTLERLVVDAKTARSESLSDILAGYRLKVGKNNIVLLGNS